MTETKHPRNAPLTLELNGYQVDFLADWARIDGEYMRTTGTLDQVDEKRLENRRETLSMAVAAYLLPSLHEIDPSSDLAAAIRERAEGYEHYRATHPKPAEGDE